MYYITYTLEYLYIFSVLKSLYMFTKASDRRQATWVLLIFDITINT